MKQGGITNYEPPFLVVLHLYLLKSVSARQTNTWSITHHLLCSVNNPIVTGCYKSPSKSKPICLYHSWGLLVKLQDLWLANLSNQACVVFIIWISISATSYKAKWNDKTRYKSIFMELTTAANEQYPTASLFDFSSFNNPFKWIHLFNELSSPPQLGRNKQRHEQWQRFHHASLRPAADTDHHPH